MQPSFFGRADTWDRPPLCNASMMQASTGMNMGLERTATWDRPPLQDPSRRGVYATVIQSIPEQSMSMLQPSFASNSGAKLSAADRTSTWDRSALSPDARTASLSQCMPATPWAQSQIMRTVSKTGSGPALERTATWDRPPMQALPVAWSQASPVRSNDKAAPSMYIDRAGDVAMARTNTVLERVREASDKSMNTLNRPSTYPSSSKPVEAPSVFAVPPTTLSKNAWQPLPVRQSQQMPLRTAIPSSAPARSAASISMQQQMRRGHAPLRRANTIADPKAHSRTAADSSSPSKDLQVPSFGVKTSQLHRAHTVSLGRPASNAGTALLDGAKQPSFVSCLVRADTTGSTSASEEVLYRGQTLLSSSSQPRPPLLRTATSSGVSSSFETARSTSIFTPEAIRRAPTLDLGFVRTQSSRSASVAAAKRSDEQQPPPAHEADERAASVPPGPVQAEQAVHLAPSSFSFSKDAAEFVPSNFTQATAASEEVASHSAAWADPKQTMGRELLKMALRGDSQRQLRIIVAGLMGSGKSTLCRMLANLLGGVWVNQDEFSHKGKGAKRAFLSEVARAASDKSVPVLLVDKINTMRQHRREILEAMESGVVGDILLIQLRHPEDVPDSFDLAVKLCLSRIQGRGEGHRTLKPSDPKIDIAKILRQTVSGVEPMDAKEVSRFAAHYTVDMKLSPPEMVQKVLSDLEQADFLWNFAVDDLMEEQRIQQAFEFTCDAEANLAGAAAKPKAAASKAKAGARRNDGSSKPKKPAPLWIWVLEFDAAATESIRNLWNSSHGGNASQLSPLEEYHVTLLYLGGGSDTEIASRHPSLQGEEDVRRLREELANREGVDLEVLIQDIVWDDRLAAATVCLPVSGLCANLHPHITLSLAPGIAPRVSNELLARRAANENIRTGLGPWLSQLGLQQYEAQALEWCVAMGAASADEIAENAGDLAAAVENVDAEQRERVQAIFARSAPGELQISTSDMPLSLRARIVGRRRGQ